MNAAQQAAIERARARLQGSITGGAYDFTEEEERDFTEPQRAALERARARLGQRGAPNDAPTALGGGLSRGVDILQGALGSAVEGVGSTLGFGGLEAYGAGVAARNEEQLQQKEQYATRLGDVEGVSSGLKYMGGLAGESAPQMGVTMAGAAAGGLAGSVVPVVGTTVGAVIGGIAANLPYFYGSNRERQKEAIERGERTELSEGAAALTAVPQSALDAIVTAIGAKFVFKPAAEVGGGIFTRVAKGAGVGAATEVPTEIGQQLLERAQAGLDIASEEAVREYVEAGIAGGLLGGAIGGPVGALRPSNSQTTLTAELTQEELDLQAAQLAEDEKAKDLEAEAVRQQGLTRMAAAKSFVPFSTFKSQRDARRNADVLNPQTEIGQAYVEYKLTANKYPANEKEEKALIKKFLKDFIPQDDGEAAIEEFNQALDQHAAAVASGAVTPTMNDKPKPAPAPEAEVAAPVEQTQAQDTQEEAAPAKAPKPESAKVAEARAYAEEVLGPEWETTGGLSQEFAERKGFYKKGKDGKTTWQRSVDREAAALQETTTPEVDATTEEAPVNALLDNEGLRESLKPQQVKVYDALLKAVDENATGNLITVEWKSGEKDNETRGWAVELNNTELAKISGIENSKSAKTAVSGFSTAFKNALSGEQVREALIQKGALNTEAETLTAEEGQQFAAGVGGDGTLATIGTAGGTQVEGASANQSAAKKKAETQRFKDAGMTDEQIKAFYNPENEAASAEAELGGQVLEDVENARFAVDNADKLLRAQWAANGTPDGPSYDDLSMNNKIDWMETVYSTLGEANQSEVLSEKANSLREITDATTQDNESGRTEVQEPSGDQTGAELPADTGRGTEADTKPAEGDGESFTAGETKAPVVETKRKKQLRKKPDPDVSTREQSNRLMPETFKTGEAFVADAYHGTTTDIVEFDNSRLGDNTGAASAAEAFFFAGKGETASSYAESTSPRQQEADFNRSFEVSKKWLSGKTLNAKEQEILSAMLDRSSELDDGKAFVDGLVAQTKKNPGTSTQLARRMAQTLRPAKRPQVQMRRIKMGNPLVKDFKGKKFRDETYAGLIKKAKAAGHDGVVLLNTYDVAGKKKEDLTDADMDTIFGVFDAKDITNTFKVREDNTKFGVPTGSFAPASRAAFEQEVKNLTGSTTNMRIHVFDTEADALAAIEEGSVPEPDMPMLKRAKPFGWVVEDENGEPNAHFILDRVPAGREKSAFLHEVGGHVGIDAILEENDRRMIATQIYRWAGQNDNSLESITARRTISRIGKAADLGAVSEGSIVSEAVAYFLEEAALAGVEPSTNSTVGKFVKKLRDLFLAAFDRLGFNVAELTAQDVIDLAYGAAYIELMHGRTEVNTQNPVTFSPSMTATENNGEVDPLLANREGETRFGVPESETQNQVSWTSKRLGTGAAEMLTNLRVLTEAPLDATKNLDRLIRENEEKMPSARKWFDFMLAAEATKNEIFGLVEDVINQSRQFTMERQELVNDFLGASTFYQKWGYDPQWTDRKTGKPVKVTIDPTMKKKYDRLTAEEQQLVRDVFAHGRTMQAQMQEVAEKLGVSKFFKFDSRLQGPYAPLKRFGNYVGELKSQELLDAEADLDSSPTPIKRKKLEELKSSGDHYVISFFESLGAAQTFVNANQDKFAYADAAEKAVTYEESRPGGAQAYEKILGAVNANLAGLDQSSKDAMAKLVRDMYFQTLDDSNARLSGTKRLNRAGYDKNMLRAFAEHGMAQANLIAQMKHGGDISTALVGAYKEARKTSGQLMPVYNKIALKFQRTMTPRTGMLADLETNVMKFNSFYMLTSSLGYFFQNMTQPYFAVAQISGEFGWRQAQTWGKLLSGYGVAKKVINTGFLNQVKNVTSMGLLGGNSTVELDIDKAPPELRPVLKELQLRGVLDVGVTEDLRHVNMSPNVAVRAYDEMTHRLYQSARYVEANNRIASAVAAFKMAQANPQKMKRLKMTPAEFAIRIVQDTQGNFSKLDAPAAFDVLPKAPLQFRKYQFQMGWLHIDAAKQAFKGADPDMKKAGFRKLSLMMGYTGVFGGLASVPMANVASSVVQAVIASLSGDDEENPPKSLERWIRENVEDERTATLLTRGVPAALGWDFSQKLDQSDLFMPYNSKYVQMDPSRDGSLLFAAQLALGPTGTVVGNIGNIADFINRGNYYRAAEYAMPKGMRSYLETMRFAGRGYETRSGLEITNPTQFDVVDLLTNAIGLPSTDINQIKWTRGQQVEITQWFSKETARIKRGYLNAHEDRDRAAKARYRDEFRELQKAKDRVRPFFNDSRSVLKRASVSELIRAPRARAREQRRLDSVTGN